MATNRFSVRRIQAAIQDYPQLWVIGITIAISFHALGPVDIQGYYAGVVHFFTGKAQIAP